MRREVTISKHEIGSVPFQNCSNITNAAKSDCVGAGDNHDSTATLTALRPFDNLRLYVKMVGKSGNALVSINVVALHRARLVLGWVTAFRAGTLSHYVTSHPGQLSLSSFRGR